MRPVLTLLFVTLALVILGLGSLFACSSESTEDQEFSVAAWHRAGDDSHRHRRSPRWDMVPGLLRRHALVGMSRADVEALLGPADSERWSDLYPYPGWSLGIRPGSTDGTGLILEFGDDGRVRRVLDPGR